MRQYSRDEIEEHEGYYDKDGFYIMQEGDFFDNLGYYYDKEGFNEIGGFYDPVNGQYVEPNDLDDNYMNAVAEYYDELAGEDD